MRTYDAKDGQRRWVTEVVADNVRFLDKRGNTNLQDIGMIGSEVEYNEEDIPF